MTKRKCDSDQKEPVKRLKLNDDPPDNNVNNKHFPNGCICMYVCADR
jgi:hypothetical protein